jgi:hypothetical protein
MTTQGLDARLEENRGIYTQYKFFYKIFGGVVLVGIGVFIGWMLFADKEGYIANLFTDGISIVITVFILDLWARHRDERREGARLKAALIGKMGSQLENEARRAVEELRLYGWLVDGSLKGQI